MIKYFNGEAIRLAKDNVKVAPRGFRYGFIPNLFKEEVYEELIATFPDVNKFKLVDKQSGGGRKRFYIGPAYDTDKRGGCVCFMDSLPKIWRDVLQETASPELISLLNETTGVSFNSLSIFGLTFGNEGCMQEAHIDGAVRDNPTFIKSPIACLMYFNKNHEGSSGTRIYEVDGKTELFKAQSMRNGLFFFEQHIDSWHGFPIVPTGEERRLVSVAYNRETAPILPDTSISHKLTCVPGLKHKAKLALGKQTY